MDFMFDWEADGDRFSFDDSDRFEEDSLCSWISEPESLCNNWRGWRKQNGGPPGSSSTGRHGPVPSLVELGSQAVAYHIPFEVVEHFYPPIPEQLQLRIAFWSFAENEEDIRLYSCLSNGSADEFNKGDHLYKARAVRDALQIGFHLSATVVPPQSLSQAKSAFNVAVMFDRRRITSCSCTCGNNSWCAHVVALCLFRIHQANQVCLRAPVSESLNRLHRDQLQKFAQYLISELPQQILPTAQRLLDELLSSQHAAINTVCGAPDPTAGASASEQTTWCLDETTLHDNIKKTLIKFCVPSPIVFSDVNYLSSTAPPAAAEWQSLLRPLRGREPEGMWNLLSIAREMFRRNDSNAIPLLEILTEEVLTCEQILVWWFNTKISSSHNSANSHSNRGNQNSSSSSQHAASSMCDEIVTLWRLSALNPSLSPIQRDDLCTQLKDWHIKTIDKVRKARGNVASGNAAIKKSDIEIFSGFKSGIEGTQLDWKEYPIPGLTHMERDWPRWKFSFGKGLEECRRSGRGKCHNMSAVSASAAVHNGVQKLGLEAALAHAQAHHHAHNAAHAAGGAHKHHLPARPSQDSATSDLDAGSAAQTDGACSSSSEGFCENDKDEHHQDSDSDLGDADLPRPHKHSSSKKGGRSLPSGPTTVAPPDGGVCMAAGPSSSNNGLVSSSLASYAKHDEQDSDSSLPGPSGYEAAAGAGATAQSSTAAASASAAAALPKGEQSESQQSSDEYQVYFYDPKAKVADTPADKKKKSDEPNYFAGIRKLENKQELLFARAEGLHAHGHTREACLLAKQLAEEMLNNPPDLSQEAPPPTGKGKKKKAQNNISSFASTTLAKAAFLCSVLLEDSECHHLAFKVGMFGLEMPRPPASSKALEVKLAHQESELTALLKRIPLGPAELNVIRDRAEQLRSGKLKSRGEALLPLTLASFIFDSLCLPVCNQNGSNNRGPTRSPPAATRSPTDEKLGFEAAVAALGLKANVSEADHPLLCEGTRRQRGDLAIAMLVHYKDDQVKLSKIMDKLLDKAVHQLYKAPSLTTYLSASQTASAKAAAAAAAAAVTSTPRPSHAATPPAAPTAGPSGAAGPPTRRPHPHKADPSKVSFGFENDCDKDDAMRAGQAVATVTTIAGDTHVSSAAVESSPTWQQPEEEEEEETAEAAGHSLDYLNLEQNMARMKVEGGSAGSSNARTPSSTGGGARPKTRLANNYKSKDTDSSAVEEDNPRSDYKSWEAKFRCTNLKTIKKHSVGMAAVDSSAPETTSSDNSPTLVRRNWAKHQGPGSDSGSSGKSSDSLGSSSSGDKGAAAKCRDNESPPCVYAGARFAPHLVVDSRSSTPNVKGARYKGKNRIMPTVPNMPSEASAHFMFELAKTLLNKAGGTSSTSLFTQPAANTTHNGPHRNLHLCAFQVGLYALGLHNCVSPNWLSRTYSSHVSWITGQAMEIGSAAINILIDTWEGHLTPPEVASLADRASRGRDPNMVRAAAELALSCLPHAHALNPNEIQRALIQCKEQSREMLERACLAVESAAKGGGVYPEVLFDVAKRWYELYEEAMLGHAAPSRAAMAAVVTQAQQVQQALVPVNMAPAQQIVVENNNSPPMMQLVPCQQMGSVSGPAQVAVSVAAQPQQVTAAQVQVAAMPQLQYSLPPPPGHPHQMAHQYMAPYSYVQQIAPNFGHHYSQPHIPLQTHSIHPSYLATYPYQNQAFSNVQHLQNMHANAATLYHATHMRPPPPTAVQVAYTTQASPLMQNRPQHAVAHMQNKFNQVQLDAVAVPTTQVLVMTTQSNINAANQSQQQQQSLQQQLQQQQQQESLPAQNSAQMNYLLSAYRVGMLAMETLARRVHDDRPQTKYARNPPYGEDVKWLLSIAMKLDLGVAGTTHLQQFCASAVNAVVSPFILQDIAIESAHYLARNNPAQVTNQLRSPALNSVVQKCLQMFIQCTHQRMHHITQAEYEEFVGIVCSARAAFYLTPGGMVQFNELLQSLRRSKSCKKDLWQRIVNALATGNI